MIRDRLLVGLERARSSSNSRRRYFARVSERRIISSDFLPCGNSFPLIVSIPVKRPSWRATRCSPSRTWRRAVSTVLHSLSAVCISMARRFSVNRSSPPALANTCPLARRMSRLCAFSRKLEFVPSHDTTPEPSSPGRRESCPTNRGGQYVRKSLSSRNAITMPAGRQRQVFRSVTFGVRFSLGRCFISVC